MAKRKLKNLQIAEISLVDKGASGDDKHAPRVVFWKGKSTVSKPSFVEKIRGVLPKKVKKQEEDPEAPRTKEMMLNEIMEALPPELRDNLMLIMESMAASPPGPVPEPAPKPVEQLDDEMQKRLEKASPELASYLQKMHESTKRQAEINKRQADEIADLRKRRERDEANRKREEYRKTLDDWLPGDLDDAADLLYEVGDKLGEKHQDTLASILRVTANVSKGSSRFRERGSRRPGDDNNTADSKLETLAKKMVDDGKAKTIEAARVKLMKTQPELRREIGDANRGRVTLGR